MVHTRASDVAVAQTPPTREEDEDSSDSDKAPPPKKRKGRASETASAPAKKTDKGKGKARGSTGKLAFILEAPTEIVLEILSYLAPLDILNLSYVDKELRARLTSPSSKPVWVAARENLPGLPDCPVDFTEWGYARFLFVNRCELCGGIAHGLQNMSSIRIRLCSRCDKLKCVSAFECHISPLELADLVPIGVNRRESYSPFNGCLVFKPAVDRILHRLSQLKDNKEELKDFRRERSEFVTKIANHAAKLSDWLSRLHAAVEEDNEAIRSKRLSDIWSRLENQGYERRDMRSDSFLRHRVVRQPVQLTDKLWPTVLRHLEPIVQENRQQRLQDERCDRIRSHLKTRFSSLWNSLSTPFDKFTYIPVLDFLDLPAVASVIQAALNLPGPGIDISYINGSFDSNLAAINLEIDRFRIQMRRRLFIRWARFNPQGVSVSTAFTADGATTMQHLCLATTVYQQFKLLQPACSCRHPIHFATLFRLPFHRGSCAYARASTEPTAPDCQPTLKQKWSYYSARLTTTRSAYLSMRTIVTEAGLNIDSSTSGELEALGPYVPRRTTATVEGPSNVSPVASTTWTEEYSRLVGPVELPVQLVPPGLHMGSVVIGVDFPSDEEYFDSEYDSDDYW